MEMEKKSHNLRGENDQGETESSLERRGKIVDGGTEKYWGEKTLTFGHWPRKGRSAVWGTPPVQERREPGNWDQWPTEKEMRNASEESCESKIMD